MGSMLAAVLLLCAAAATQAAEVVNGFSCPSNVKILSSGADLSLNRDSGTTYLLQPGDYAISGQRTSLLQGQVCYIGKGGVTVKLLAIPVGGQVFEPGYAGPSTLAFKGLTLDGAGLAATAVVLYPDGVLYAEDVTFQGWRREGAVSMRSDNAGDATAGPVVSLKMVQFIGNAGFSGGALSCFGSTSDKRSFIDIDSALFQGNQGADGGALTVGQFCRARLAGSVAFHANAASNQGGAVYVGSQAKLSFDGSVCAHSNKASPDLEDGGGFMAVFGRAAFTTPEAAKVSANTPNDIAWVGGDRQDGVFCGTRAASWAIGNYVVSGGVCGCDADFQAASRTTCNSCAAGLDPNTCACM